MLFCNYPANAIDRPCFHWPPHRPKRVLNPVEEQRARSLQGEAPHPAAIVDLIPPVRAAVFKA